MVAPWIARNEAVFGIPHLTTNDTVVLVYFTGAGAYQVQHGVERAAAQRMIAEEFGLHSPEDMWNYHDRGLSPAAMDRAARAAVPRVFRRYPGPLLKSSAIGLAKAFLSHDAATWGQILRLPWINPGAGGLLRLDRAAWSRWRDNPTVLAVISLYQPFLNALLVVMALSGIIRAYLRRQDRACVSLLLLLLLFFLM